MNTLEFSIALLAFIVISSLLVRWAFSSEVLTPEGVCEELSPILDDPARFSRHVNTYIRHMKIEGEGEIASDPNRSDSMTEIHLRMLTDSEKSSPDMRVNVHITLLFLAEDAPTEIKIGDRIEYRGYIKDVKSSGGILSLTVIASEILYVKI